jgi:hypothetical protein
MKKILLTAAVALSATVAHANPSNGIEGFKNFKFDTATVNDVVNAGGKCEAFRSNYGTSGFKIGTKCEMGANTVLGIAVRSYDIEFNAEGKIVSFTFAECGRADYLTPLRTTFGAPTKMSSKQPDRNKGEYKTEYNSEWKFANGNSITTYTVLDPTGRYCGIFELMNFNSTNKSTFEATQKSNDF